MSLGGIFERLPRPRQSSALPAFATSVVPGGPHRLGKDARGAAALLLALPQPDASGRSVPIELEHLVVQHAVPCLIWKEDGSSEECVFTLIRCREPDRVLTGYYLGVIDSLIPLLGTSPSEGRVGEVVGQLVELFRALQMPRRKTVQGLWAELLLIAQASAPRVLVRAWHAVPEEAFDFSGPGVRLEVKSAVGPERQHYFSLGQLVAPAGTRVVVASLFVERAGGGVSISELSSRVRSRLAGDVDLMLKVERVVAASLGEDWRLGLEESFDVERAVSSLAFFPSDSVPSVDPSLPPNVYDVRFRANLTGATPLDLRDLQRAGGVFEAAAPLRRGSF